MQRRTLLLIAGAIAVVVALAGGMAFVTWRVWRAAKRAVTTTVLAPQEKTIDLGTLVTQVRELIASRRRRCA